MARPRGDKEIKGTGGLYKIRHSFPNRRVKCIAVYYGYFEEFGVVYLSCIDETAEDITFSREEYIAIKDELEKVIAELNRLKTIRISDTKNKGNCNE
jgi:hypothetical protein